MKKLILALIAGAMIAPSTATAQVRVNGYFKSDGTYVAPHYRSSPNNTTLDNYSTKGNVNPYTGAFGTRSQAPTYSPKPPLRFNPPEPYKPTCFYNCPK